YVLAGEVELEAGDAGQASGGGANLGGEVGQGRDVVPDDGRRVCELRARELHAVAGVSGEAYGHGLDLFNVSLPRGGGRVLDDGAHTLRLILCSWDVCVRKPVGGDFINFMLP